MRRAFRTTYVVAALAAACGLGTASIAAAAPTASSSAAAKRCGTGQYEKKCIVPTITFKAPSAKCQSIGADFDVPTLTFTSVAGIHRITVKLGDKTVKTVSFTGDGPTQYELKGLTIATKGLSSGSHQVQVAVTDVMSKTTTKSMHFIVCKPMPVATKPVFTG